MIDRTWSKRDHRCGVWQWLYALDADWTDGEVCKCGHSDAQVSIEWEWGVEKIKIF